MNSLFKSVIYITGIFLAGFINHCLAGAVCDDFNVYIVNESKAELNAILGSGAPVYVPPGQDIHHPTFIGSSRHRGQNNTNSDGLTIIDVSREGGGYRDKKILETEIEKIRCDKQAQRDEGKPAGSFTEKPITYFESGHIATPYAPDTGGCQLSGGLDPIYQCVGEKKPGTFTLGIKK